MFIPFTNPNPPLRASTRKAISCPLCLIAALIANGLIRPANAEVAWQDVLDVKRHALTTAAENAVAQQRRGHLPDVPLDNAIWTGVGGVDVETTEEWDADGDGASYRVRARDIPRNEHDNVNIPDRIAIRFDEPMNVRDLGTGFALWVYAPDGVPETLRMGVHLKIAGRDDDPVIFADTPVIHRFGDNPHLVYFDWGYVLDHGVRPFNVPDESVFEKVEGLDLTLVQRFRPYRDQRLTPRSAVFFLDGLRIVDWFDGSYDSARFPAGDEANAAYPIVAQGRTQQVSILTVLFGGEPGAASAIRAMDMMARIQSWDGSWPEMRTRMQGEYTHGMMMDDLAQALAHLRDEQRPELDETVEIRHWRMPRDELYEQMLYRAAMSRTPGPITEYADSYIAAGGALDGGVNRSMAFILAQHTIASQVLTDADQKRRVLDEYDANMRELVAAQGKYSGGWPIFAEGNRFNGQGLRWDAGYSTEQISLMVNASRATGDPRWGQMLRKWETVLEAMMMPDGIHIDGGISERGSSVPADLKAADITFQEAVKHDAGMIAQWGANTSEALWRDWPGGPTLWPAVANLRGYALGAYPTWQVYDMQAEPEPRDLGIVFPRQWPVWTSRWFNKAGEHARTSELIAGPSGLVNTFAWEIGQYPKLTAVPIMPTAAGDTAVAIEPLRYEGNVLDLSPGEEATIAQGPVDGPVGDRVPMTDDQATLRLEGPTRVQIAAGDVVVHFRAIPRGGGSAELGVRLLREIEAYHHAFADAAAADAPWPRPGMNLANPLTGTEVQALDCWPDDRYPLGHAVDGDPQTQWLIGQFLPGSAVRFTFREQAGLDRLVLAQADWRDRFHLAGQVSVELGDGTMKTLTLEQAPGRDVELDLEGVRTDSLTIRLEQIHERPESPGNVGGWRKVEIIAADD